MKSGFQRPDGERVQGLRELMERLRQRRQEELDRGDLGGAFDEIAQELNQVVAEERQRAGASWPTKPRPRVTSGAGR